MSGPQIFLAALFGAACVYTVVGYPNKYGALSGRSRLFRTVGLFLLDLLLGLTLLGTFLDFRYGVTPKVALGRLMTYVLACVFLALSLVCIAVLDSLESLVVFRRTQRDLLYRDRDDEGEDNKPDGTGGGGSGA